MNIVNFYRKCSVKIDCNGISGSGCIFQPNSKEYTYIFTAKHCLRGKDENIQEYKKSEVLISSEVHNDQNFEILEIIEHDTLDIVLILIKYIDIGVETFATNNIYNKKMGIYGYPEIFQDHDLNLKSHKLNCELIDEIDAYLTVQTPHTSSYMNDATDNIVGFSGSGIYVEHNNQIFLVGILTELKDSFGTFNALVGININEFKSILLSNNLKDIIPFELSSFERYLDSTFEVLEGSMKAVLHNEAKKIVDGSPQHIINNLKKRIFLPHNEDFELFINNKKIWEGWLAFLTYIFINLDQETIENSFENSYKSSEQNQIKFFYSNQSSLPGSIVSLCDIDIYDEMNSGTLIVINSPKTPPLKEINHEKFKNNVLRSIDNDLLYAEKGKDIFDPSYYKEMRCIHIDLFFDSFSDGFDVLEINKVKEIIKKGVKEVLSG